MRVGGCELLNYALELIGVDDSSRDRPNPIKLLGSVLRILLEESIQRVKRWLGHHQVVAEARA